MRGEKFDRDISDAWNQAERDLGIRVTAPIAIKVEGQDLTFEAHVADFGGPAGTIAVGQRTCQHRTALKKMGYFVSQLFPGYREHQGQRFIATLDDWRWFGQSGEETDWYTGKPWS
jgi:hypothetical protein